MARQSTGTVVEYDTKAGRGYALRFRAGGKRRYLTLGTDAEGWGRQRAEEELAYVLAQVRRGAWEPPKPAPLLVEAEDPSFHEFASEWLEAVSPGLAAKTQERYRWQLTHHLLPYFKRHRLSEITVAEVDRYRDSEVRERKLLKATAANAKANGVAVERGLSPDTINGTLTRLGQILDVADERGLIERNPLRVNPRRRKLKASKPRAVWLDGAGQIGALLDAAGELDAEAREDRRGVGRRAMLATLALGGLRIGELCALRWRDVDLAAGRPNVGDAKTDAGRRYVDLLAPLRSDLAVHKAATKGAGSADYVFPTAKGNARTINNVRERVFNPAVKRADANLERDDLGALPEGLTPHKLRHTFASVLIALGHDPAYVMEQIGHADPAFTLRLYTHAMRRQDGERKRLRALVEASGDHPLDDRVEVVQAIASADAETMPLLLVQPQWS